MKTKNIFKSLSAAKIMVFAVFLMSGQTLPCAYAQQEQDIKYEEMRTADKNTKNQRRVYNTSKHSYMSPSEMTDENALKSISESFGVFKINGNFVGTVIKGRVFSDMGTGKQVENAQYTAMLNERIKQSAIDKGLLVKEGNVYKKAKLSKKDYDILVNEISKETNISENTVNDTVDNIAD